MSALRVLLMRHRRFAALLLALALCLKALVPMGYMLDATGATLTMRICDGQTVKTVQLAIPGKKADPDTTRAQEASHCPYTALGMGGLPGADPLLLAAAIAFILLLGFAPLVSPALRPIPFVSPPLRGPPALAL
ncbi:MAG: hypothetical protein BGO57_16305 [Sphingomonadales bacterium 63-6]|nr:MAG: hypothetical protein BGO57_16305 [Sphingomonadales bacterium 63-6]